MNRSLSWSTAHCSGSYPCGRGKWNRRRWSHGVIWEWTHPWGAQSLAFQLHASLLLGKEVALNTPSGGQPTEVQHHSSHDTHLWASWKEKLRLKVKTLSSWRYSEVQLSRQVYRGVGSIGCLWQKRWKSAKGDFASWCLAAVVTLGDDTPGSNISVIPGSRSWWSVTSKCTSCRDLIMGWIVSPPLHSPTKFMCWSSNPPVLLNVTYLEMGSLSGYLRENEITWLGPNPIGLIFF